MGLAAEKPDYLPAESRIKYKVHIVKNTISTWL
jgi:hypothetical protein